MRIIMRKTTPSSPMATSKAFTILYFLPNYLAVFLNMYLANSIPVIEPAHIPNQHAPVATKKAYQKSLKAIISPKPDPTIRIVPGIMQVYATKKIINSANVPTHLLALSQFRKAFSTILVMSLLTIIVIVPPITMKATKNLQSHTYQGFGPSSSSESSPLSTGAIAFSCIRSL